MVSSKGIGILLALLLFGTTAPAVFSYHSPSPPAQDGTPPGQMVRQGVTGTVLAVSGSSIVVETQFGNVTIDIGPETVIDAPPEKDVGIGSITVGSKVAVSLNRPIDVGPPVTPEVSRERTGTPPGLARRVSPAETDTPPTVPEPSFRTATASRIVVIPSQATRTHNRSVVESVTPGEGQGKGRLKLLSEDGEITELELPDDGGEVVEGSDVILIVRGKGGQPVTTDTPIELRGLQSTEKIAERLERLQVKFQDNPEKAAKFADLLQKQVEHLEARLQRTAANAPPEARGGAKALNKAQGKCPDAGDTDSECPGDKGQGGGPPEDKGQGGGPPEDKGQGGGGPPEDKGKK